MALESLGYFGVRARSLDDWSSFGQKFLGLELVDRSRKTLTFRMDDRRQRVVVHEDDVNEGNRAAFMGWEVSDAQALDRLAASLEHARVAVVRAPRATADERRVKDLIAFEDPAGNRLEAFYGAEVSADPFTPGRAISGFRTGPLGMGHIVLNVDSVDRLLPFYTETLGFELSDFTLRPFKAYFFHLNPRHHSFAMVETGKSSIHHLMMELYMLDDVGQAYDLAQGEDGRIATTLGRHSNDFMTSFYANTPSGFFVEYGWGGRSIDPTLMKRSGAPVSRTIMSQRTAFWITDILSDDEARAYAFGRGGSLEFPFAVAAKTGTSQAYHDNWTIGYTRDVTVGVWVGNFDRRPLIGSSGVTGAGPIFHAVMLAAVRRANGTLPDPQVSATSATAEGTTRRVVCALSGLIATPACPRQIEEWVADEPHAKSCDWHRTSPRGVVVQWPAEFREWAASQHLLNVVTTAPSNVASTRQARVQPSEAAAGGAVASASGVRVLSPPDGAVYLIDPTLRREFQTIGLRGAADGADPLEWRVDDQTIATSASDASVNWPLAPGRHVISARDSQGHSAFASIVVK